MEKNHLYFSLLFAIWFGRVLADEAIYTDDALSSTWQDWSWGSTISYAATDVKEGTTSVSVDSGAYSALSWYDTSAFANTFAGLKFDLAGDNPDITISLTDTVTSTNSPNIVLADFGLDTSADSFTTFLVDFNNLPPNGGVIGEGAWNRINFQAGGSGAIYHLDNVSLLDEIVVTPEILSAEPLGNNLIALTTKGAVDLSSVKVTLNGKAIAVSSNVTYTPLDSPSKSITYFALASSLAAGTLGITAGTSSFNYTLPASQATTVDQTSTRPISPRIYGVNFPADAAYIKDIGVTFSRWGGNAVTAYNPEGDFTNAGADWYYENRANGDGSANDWVGWVKGAGSSSLLTIPALDWVAKDATSYSFPKTVYPDQAAFDPYNADAGNGLYSNGSRVLPVPDPATVYTPWTPAQAQTWLSGLSNKPDVVAIDNEIEIASSTHYDMHSAPIGFDEELDRVLKYATVAKAALPNVLVTAPSTCAWWFYWTSVIGYTDNAAHNNTDFLPWFLSKLQAHDKAAGKRFLDFLDIHYYFAPDLSAGDAAAKALRLRMTRSLWDTTYVDESWIGTSTPQSTQPNATIVQLIPRMKALISKYYPDTKLSISEWSSTADTDITGGLVTADALGIFGKYGVDSANYWGDSGRTTPVGLAYWLYRGTGTAFGSFSAKVTVTNFNPDVLGVYAGTNGSSKPTLVIVNKDPSKPTSLNINGLATGKYFIRHFGGAAGVAKFQTTQTLKSANYFVVPAYTAVFLQYLS